MGMLRWFVGLGPKPTFDRWTYWEKFDYWAIVSIVVVIGISGLIIWLPNLFAHVLTGAALNEAQMVHHEISLMAASFLLSHSLRQHTLPPGEVSDGLVGSDGIG